METLQVRYYNISVTASDSAGNTGNDACTVVVIPSCIPSLYTTMFRSCEIDKSAKAEKSAEAETSGKSGKSAKVGKYSLASVDEAVAQSQILHKVAEAKLVWKHGLAHLP